MKKMKKWIYPRHGIIRDILYWPFRIFAYLVYGAVVENMGIKRTSQSLIVMNHQTAFDQFFISISFRQPIYFIASEDLFSNGFISKLLSYAVAPIPIKKQTNDIRAVRDCIRVAKEGGTIALAPEGNRTFSGKTEYIKPSILKLVRVLKLPLVIYRIEGGYGVHPRWSDVIRRGRMRTYVLRTLEYEEYSKITDEELEKLIVDALYVNEGAVTGIFRHKKRAEYLERCMYYCPNCGLTEFHSEGDTVKCLRCDIKVRYLPTKELVGVDKPFPYRFVTEWYKAQCDFVNKLDPESYRNEPLYRDRANLSQVILYKRKERILTDAPLLLYGDRIQVGDDYLFTFDEITAITVVGRNKLNIYYDNKVYQIRGDKRFNALKYVNMYFRYKNVKERNENGEFLGL